jgi:hypothetical protein
MCDVTWNLERSGTAYVTGSLDSYRKIQSDCTVGLVHAIACNCTDLLYDSVAYDWIFKSNLSTQLFEDFSSLLFQNNGAFDNGALRTHKGTRQQLAFASGAASHLESNRLHLESNRTLGSASC